MREKTFSEKWDREEELYSKSTITLRKANWKQYVKWIGIGIVILVITLLLQKFL